MQRNRDKVPTHIAGALGIGRSSRASSFASSSSAATFEDSDTSESLPLTNAGLPTSHFGEAWRSPLIDSTPVDRHHRPFLSRPRRKHTLNLRCPWPISLRRLLAIFLGSAVLSCLCAYHLNIPPRVGWRIAPPISVRAIVPKLRHLGPTRWRFSIPPWRQSRVAIYAGTGTDWDVCTSLIHTLTRPEMRARTSLSFFVADASEVKESKLEKGVWSAVWPEAGMQEVAKLLAVRRNYYDAIVVPPISSNNVETTVHIIQAHPSTRFIVLINSLRSLDADDNALSRLLKEYTSRPKQITFIATDVRLVDPLRKCLARMQREAVSIAGKTSAPPDENALSVGSILPVAKLPRVDRPLSVTTFRPFRSNAVLFLDDEKATVDYINSLVQEFYAALEANPEGWGYTVAYDEEAAKKTYVKMRGKWSSLHVIVPSTAPPTVRKRMLDQLVLPPDSGDMIITHGVDDASVFYQKLSSIHLFLPSFRMNGKRDDKLAVYDPVVALGLSLRVPVLLPHSLSHTYASLKRPALITFPDDPHTKVGSERSMPIFKAVWMLKHGNDPRRRMAWMARPWDRLDVEPKWNMVMRDVEDENVVTLANAMHL